MQINGKLKATFEIEKGTVQEKLISTAKKNEIILKILKDKKILKEFAVIDKIVNFVVS